jgi:hypothetical protein
LPPPGEQKCPILPPPLSNSKTVPMFPKHQELSKNFLALRAN